MKYLAIIFSTLFVISCGSGTNEEQGSDEQSTSEELVENVYPYTAGEEFDASNAVSPEEFYAMFSTKGLDTMKVTIESEVLSSCKRKGCWMKVDAADAGEMMVRFKDYDFFVPLDAAGHRTTINGFAYYDTISVEELRHYAMDAGADADSVESITDPKVVLSYEATGVYVQ
ncbi:MAG TPA: DUF4920 domain-containing protein [Flavobacteriales bacterium]|jgi:hypothetical protein|nr:DUF4920 domain-containing protein [Flavobacteriales bacterium]